MKSENTKVYTVEDLRAVLGISKANAYALTHREGFPVLHVGRRLLIPKAALDEWLLQQRAGAAV